MKVIKPFGRNIPAGSLHITLCDTNPDVVHAWCKLFDSVGEVEIVEGSILETDAHALVSPANSFGDMGGGVDKHIDNFFNGAAQPVVRSAIGDRFYGELPVGMAIIVEMPGQRFPFLVVAPTMRIASDVRGTINAYLAMRAVLIAILQHNQANARAINKVAISGLCTGVGGMSAFEAAEQMRAAHDNVIGGGWQRVISPIRAPYAYKAK